MPKVTTKPRTRGKPSTRFTLGRYDHSGFRPICRNLSSDQVESLAPVIPGAIATFAGWEARS